MSAYVVADRTINKIVTFLMKAGDIDAGKLASPLDEAPYRSQGPRTAAIKLGQAMYDLNVKAVNHLYDDHKPDKAFDEPYVFEEERVSRVQALKSLGCWLYQCNEGDFDKTKLWKRMWKVRTDIAMNIVCDSEAYDKAEWG